jgi:hypothetical protein
MVDGVKSVPTNPYVAVSQGRNLCFCVFVFLFYYYELYVFEIKKMLLMMISIWIIVMMAIGSQKFPRVEGFL